MSVSSIRCGQLVMFGGLDLAGILAQLRRDEIELELGVDFLFGRPGDAPPAFQRGQRVFVERPAHLVGAPAQRHVVLFRPGEVEQGSAAIFRLEQAHVHLQARAQPEADLVLTLRQRLRVFRERQNVLRERVHVLLGVLARERNQQIEIADGFLAAAERSRGLHGTDQLAVALDVGGQLGGLRFHKIEQESAGDLLVHLDGLKDVRFALLAEAGQVAQLALARQILDRIHSARSEYAPQQRRPFSVRVIAD